MRDGRDGRGRTGRAGTGGTGGTGRGRAGTGRPAGTPSYSLSEATGFANTVAGEVGTFTVQASDVFGNPYRTSPTNFDLAVREEKAGYGRKEGIGG